MEKLSVLGIRVDNLALEEIGRVTLRLISEKKPSIYISLGSLTVMLAKKDAAYKNIIESAELVICDGFGVKAAIRLLTGKKLPRLTGVELVSFFAGLAEKKGCRIFLLGASEAVIKEAKNQLEKSFPALIICGYSNGYSDIIITNEVKKKIKEAAPDILLAGLGQPRQEKWLSENSRELGVPVSLGVGGSFDVISGKIKRAPLLFQKLGLEWLFRMLLEPRRIKRNFVLLKYLMLIIKDKITGGK